MSILASHLSTYEWHHMDFSRCVTIYSHVRDSHDSHDYLLLLSFSKIRMILTLHEFMIYGMHLLHQAYPAGVDAQHEGQVANELPHFKEVVQTHG